MAMLHKKTAYRMCVLHQIQRTLYSMNDLVAVPVKQGSWHTRTGKDHDVLRVRYVRVK